MNALQLDEDSGFLESKTKFNSGSVFSADKKVKFLELATNISETQGIIPNINHLCKGIGIDNQTFYNHLKADAAFNAAWNQCLLNVEAHLQTKMTEFAQRPGNYMDRITALRRIAPERWNPEYKVTHVDDKSFDAMLSSAKAVDATIVSTNQPSDSTPQIESKPTDV